MADLLAAKLALARGVGAVSRRRGGGGTSAPGKLLMRLAPGAIGELGARLARGSVLISATNGKTTTAAMAAGIFERAGIPLVHNQAGANMAGGIATTLLAAARANGAIAGELGLFEVDELWLAQLAAELHPRALLLGNLFRDQLDRYGELDTMAERWEQVLHDGAADSAGSDAGNGAGARKLVLNADDPLIADLGRDQSGVLYFGVDDDSLALAGMAHAADAKHCRRCGAPYVFDAVYLGHLGHYHCESCGQSRPLPAVTATEVRLQGVRAARFTLTTAAGRAQVALALPGLYNVYNALAAAALASALEVPFGTIVAGLEASRAAFGRAETVKLSVPALPAGGGRGAGAMRAADGAPSASGAAPATRELRILLVKNPAGANEVLRTLALEPGEHDLLGVLNDHIADGRDVSWIWDADFELLAGRVRRATCSGTRAADLAARLKYAGIDPVRIDVREDLEDALRSAAADRPELERREGSAADGESAPTLFALPTYTAMLALRELLVARGEASSAWS
jgi:UDP-N-acetylmuramyl tripeptide synthase